MAYTPVEIIALVIIVGAIIKMFVLLINPKAIMNFAKSFYAKPKSVKFIALVLAAIVFYYIIQEISIIQILAVIVFVSLLMLVGLAQHINPILKQYDSQIRKGTLWKENCLYILIWLILIVWGAKELFFNSLF